MQFHVDMLELSDTGILLAGIHFKVRELFLFAAILCRSVSARTMAAV